MANQWPPRRLTSTTIPTAEGGRGREGEGEAAGRAKSRPASANPAAVDRTNRRTGALLYRRGSSGHSGSAYVAAEVAASSTAFTAMAGKWRQPRGPAIGDDEGREVMVTSLASTVHVGAKQRPKMHFPVSTTSAATLAALFCCAGLAQSAAVAGARCHRESRARRPEQFSGHALYRRSAGVDDSVAGGEGRAALFDEPRQHLQLLADYGGDVSDRDWSVSASINIDGGQTPGANILGYFDACRGRHSWKLHLLSKSHSPKVKDCHLSVSVLGDPLLQSRKSCVFGEWINVTVQRREGEMCLYCNGILVERGALNEERIRAQTANQQCSERRLVIGDRRGSGFRGLIANVTILSDPSASGLSRKAAAAGARSGLIPVNILDSASLWTSDLYPAWVSLPLGSGDKRKLISRIPACGKTICDDPAIAKSYLNSPGLLRRKRVRCHIVNLRDSDGSNSSLTRLQIRTQVKQLDDAFSPWNIEWELTTVNVDDSVLRRAQIMTDCEPELIGDGTCQSACDYDATGRDGGDCSAPTRCPRRLIANGACDAPCNTAEWGYDGGDCCTGQHAANCFDPASPKRVYMTIDELRKSLGKDDLKQLVIVPVNFMETTTVGMAGFPWDKKRNGFAGDIIVSIDHFGRAMSDTVIHEIGHVLGLWHVHRGVSEMTCHDECLETVASFQLGDLVEDTPPAIIQTLCSTSEASSSYHADAETCGINGALRASLQNNHMSYANGSCVGEKNFTVQQAARMHCYLDLAYPGWTDATTSAIAVPPKVTGASSNSVLIEWLPPLKRVYESMPHANCSLCSPDDAVLGQYAQQAHFQDSKIPPDVVQSSAASVTLRLAGPPDSPSCQRSPTSWNPLDHEGVKSCSEAECELTLVFEHAVLPYRVFIWVPWFEKMGRELFYPISKIEYLAEDDRVLKISRNVTPSCDAPYTAFTLDVMVPLKKLRLHLSTPDVSIDAAYIMSRPQNEECLLCPPLEYLVERSPGFSSGSSSTSTASTTFQDNDVLPGGSYEYRITPFIGGKRGWTSDPLKYQHNLTFCGDGVLGRHENCDDGNLESGDGCDFECRLEPQYECSGSPSSCADTQAYRHSPQSQHGFEDIWSANVSLIGDFVDGQYLRLVKIGPPHERIVCVSELHASVGYTPFEITYKVDFEKPVVAAAVLVHLAADGITADDKRSKEMRIVLLDSSNEIRSTVHTRAICRTSPVVLGIVHDLSKPFFRTRSILLTLPGSSVAVAAIGLRTFERAMNPVEQLQSASCAKPGGLFNPGTGRCAHYEQCSDRPKCPTLTAVANGRSQCTGNAEGHRCSIACNRGFVRNPPGASDIVCSNGSWTEPLPVCSAVDCGLLEVKWASVICPNGTRYGAICAVMCTTLDDHSTSTSQDILDLPDWTNSAYCQHDGKWIVPTELCVPPTCPTSTLVPDPAAAKIISLACMQSKEIETGGKCTLSCNSGYHVRGLSVRDRTTKLYCSADGRWLGDQCQRVTCPDIAGALNRCTDEFNAGSVCSVACPAPSKVSIAVACLSSGRWNATLDWACSPTATTRCLAMKNTESIHFDCTGSSLGSLCRAACINKLEQVYRIAREYPTGSEFYRKALKYFSGRVEGSYNREASYRSPLEIFAGKLICTASGEWFPPAEELRCQ